LALYLSIVERAACWRTRRSGKRKRQEALMSEKIASPCIGVCTLDPTDRTCLGCLRTADEIARWSQMSSVERVQIVLQLRVRRHAQGVGGISASRQQRRARKLTQLVS
jgi:predicted Fe-S protein YdhL (DUF1289 family)